MDSPLRDPILATAERAVPARIPTYDLPQHSGRILSLQEFGVTVVVSSNHAEHWDFSDVLSQVVAKHPA